MRIVQQEGGGVSKKYGLHRLPRTQRARLALFEWRNYFARVSNKHHRLAHALPDIVSRVLLTRRKVNFVSTHERCWVPQTSSSRSKAQTTTETCLLRQP